MDFLQRLLLYMCEALRRLMPKGRRIWAHLQNKTDSPRAPPAPGLDGNHCGHLGANVYNANAQLVRWSAHTFTY